MLRFHSRYLSLKDFIGGGSLLEKLSELSELLIIALVALAHSGILFG